jgi:formamidopyrimidine-DNA glycosylase
MPELPEVETVRRGLTRTLKGQRFTHIEARRKDLRWPLPTNLSTALTKRRIKSLERRAKYILIHFEGNVSLLLHLGMSGRIVAEKASVKVVYEKHDHVIFFTPTTRLRFHDPRRFGMMDVLQTDKAHEHKLLHHLGPEPLSKAFTGAALLNRLKGKKTAIKLALMNQEIVVGVGNIYACEALFYAGINPRKKAGKITAEEATRLVAAVKQVLKRAIAKGGSSLRDYVQSDGELGYFQHEFAVYGREGEKCKGCTCDVRKTGGVKRITQGQRSTFFCPVKQK